MLKTYFKIEYNNNDITRDISNYVTKFENTDGNLAREVSLALSDTKVVGW